MKAVATKEAEELELLVTTVMGTILGPEHPDRLANVAALASIYNGQGRKNKAEELEAHVMVMRRKTLGPNHPDVLTSMANLESALWAQGRWKEGEKLDVQVIRWKQGRLFWDRSILTTLISMWNLAHTWEAQDRKVDNKRWFFGLIGGHSLTTSE
ncbi:uncharacterized protein BO95DRAFT_479813 [Aspergillus brunneoviolaceus CBS 621.78]|uniref:Uncharacterized protein n=1 Tax=Aspergillus brunneoviolaceus CBS 621.78 TaxID=1450534 RepID=A0ACD1GI86_9EURO|nr:hypothetical protein BO95DRAFT_479813 [Aspergillus brunneoviolaceus CBS 621.78]RAH48796.1 hypothetical protein BO95DRAFT_479813 [Aspergillus brunneoviolaceus CBS 621.78]